MTKFEQMLKEACEENNLDYKIAMRIYNNVFLFIKTQFTYYLRNYDFMTHHIVILLPFVGKFVSKKRSNKLYRMNYMLSLYKKYFKYKNTKNEKKSK